MSCDSDEILGALIAIGIRRTGNLPSDDQKVTDRNSFGEVRGSATSLDVALVAPLDAITLPLQLLRHLLLFALRFLLREQGSGFGQLGNEANPVLTNVPRTEIPPPVSRRVKVL